MHAYSALVELTLSNNKLAGPLPADIGRLCALEALAIDGNELTVGRSLAR
jgi:hypothetical protein